MSNYGILSILFVKKKREASGSPMRKYVKKKHFTISKKIFFFLLTVSGLGLFDAVF